jgi:hypothetical protein
MTSATTLSERYSLDGIIQGLAADLEALRKGEISVKDAKTRAAIAHEIMRGVRLAVEAGKIASMTAKPIGGPRNG